jgi:peroxin-1
MLILSDATDPKSNTNSAVLVYPETEIYVAPRPRESGQKDPSQRIIPNANGLSIKGKEKERSARLRLIPARVARLWGEPNTQLEPGQSTGIDGLALCHPDTLERLRLRLRLTGTGPGCVKLRLVSPGDSEQKAKSITEDTQGIKEPEASQEENVKEVLLKPWDEMPEDGITLPGSSKSVWNQWAHIQ